MIADRLPVRFRGALQRARCALRTMPRSRLYPALGLGVALAAPTGLLVARAMTAGRAPTFAWTVADVEHLAPTYAYVGVASAGVLALLGCVLGRSFDRVRRLSITDPLTGLFNRRHFAYRVAEELRRGRRQGYATCILCVDIDRLKAINDDFGHGAGDQAIVAVSEILASTVRGMDAVARLGGDEFAVLLPETSATQASALSRRILKAVARRSDTSPVDLAVSIGISEQGANAEVGSDDMFAAGDAALYRAKAAGGGHAAFALAGLEPAPAASGLHGPPSAPAIAGQLGPGSAVRGPSGSVGSRWRLWEWMGNRREPPSPGASGNGDGNGETTGGDENEDAGRESEMHAEPSDER